MYHFAEVIKMVSVEPFTCTNRFEYSGNATCPVFTHNLTFIEIPIRFFRPATRTS